MHQADFLKTSLAKFAATCGTVHKAGFFAPDKLENHSSKRKGKEEKETARRKKGGEWKKAMVALLVFIN